MSTTTYPQAHLCSRGGLLHPWDVIPVEWEPTSSVWDHVDCVNFRCPRCGKVKARLYDINGDWINRYKSGTGIVYGHDEVRPDKADLLAMLHARVASIEDRNTRRTATRSSTPSQRTRTTTAKTATKGKALVAVA
jgi:hypothetical protein